jgi:hypothetical protein
MTLTWDSFKAAANDATSSPDNEIWQEFVNASGGETKVYLYINGLIHKKTIRLKDVWLAAGGCRSTPTTEPEAGDVGKPTIYTFILNYFMPITALEMELMSWKAPNVLYHILYWNEHTVNTCKEVLDEDKDCMVGFQENMKAFVELGHGNSELQIPDPGPLFDLLGLDEDEF